MYKLIFPLILFFIFSACVKPIGNSVCDTGPTLLFKYKDTSYARLVHIYYDTSKNSVYLLNPDTKLINGYRLNKGVTNGVTSVLQSDLQKLIAQSNGDGLPQGYEDSLKYKIIDRHPYTELYSVCPCTHNDTMLMNRLILKNQLGTCSLVKLP